MVFRLVGVPAMSTPVAVAVTTTSDTGLSGWAGEVWAWTEDAAQAAARASAAAPVD